MTEAITDLLGPDTVLITSKLNTKAPGGGRAVEWHQDWAFYPHTNDDLLACGILLEDVDQDNGPLMAIPGTHRGPILSHHVDGVFSGAIDPDDPLFEPTRAVTLTGAPNYDFRGRISLSRASPLPCMTHSSAGDQRPRRDRTYVRTRY